MIIVSQKRNRILNFDRTNEIWVIETPKLWKECGICKETDNFILQYGFEDNNNIGNLGFYETEERAKEVLLEITERAEGWENLKYGQPTGIAEYIYQMPEK